VKTALLTTAVAAAFLAVVAIVIGLDWILFR